MPSQASFLQELPRLDIDQLENTAHSLPLSQLCFAIAQLYLQDKRQLTGSLYAILIKQLVAHELVPGGPYHASGESQATTNLFISFLFHLFGKPLPKVDAYVQENRSELQKNPLYAELLKFIDDPSIHRIEQPRSYTTDEDTALSTRLYSEVVHELTALRPPLKSQAKQQLVRLQAADRTGEIALITYLFNSSLLQPLRHPKLLGTLSKANVYGWLAYTIYDTILDEATSLELLPLASICMRRSHLLYRESLPGSTHRSLVDNAFTLADQTNAWEVHATRFRIKNNLALLPALPSYGDFSRLANRSFPHILGPLIVTRQYSTSSQQTQLEKALRHYLIARQLNDDIHDWKEDFASGRLTPIIVSMLQDVGVKKGKHNHDELFKHLQQHFWSTAFNPFQARILSHITASRKNLTKTGLLAPDSSFFSLLNRLEHITLEAGLEYERYRLFFSEYRDFSTMQAVKRH